MLPLGNHASDSCPRLIEVALPIREISAESVRDKSLRHGHISTLHLWWARRPLATARAVVFASLVPDPDDPLCPEDFRRAVEKHLKTRVHSGLKYYRRGRNVVTDDDPYRPYEGMEDTLRNRLLAFVAKWSPEAIQFEKDPNANEPKPAELLDDRSLIKWETSDPDNQQGRIILDVSQELIRIAHGGKTPTVLDPFSGGGAIPLESGRLGCQAIANDYNPVAYLILRATCEFPQKYGKPGKRTELVDEFGRQVQHQSKVRNVLSYDVAKWANRVLVRTKERIGHLYPPGKDRLPVIGYLWARTAPCSNPACRGTIPLLRSLVVCSKSSKKAAITLNVDRKTKTLQFGLVHGRDVKENNGTMQNRGNVLCPFCEQVTAVADLRLAGLSGSMGERLTCVIVEGRTGKDYRPVEQSDLAAFQEARDTACECPSEPILPEITSEDAEEDISNSTGIRVHLYGMKTWGSLFNARQLAVMQTFVQCLHEEFISIEQEVLDPEYREALTTYLSLWLSRTAMFMSNVGLWKPSGEFVAAPFSMQAIPMVWDYPEVNLFADSSGGASGQLEWITRVIEHESSNSSIASLIRRGDASNLGITVGHVDCVVTDPPYFNAIAYADLSDYFYVWLKRCLGDRLPEVFSTPLTPKSDEATALKHRHGGSEEAADTHFVNKLSGVLSESRLALSANGILSIMFAHQSTKAWTALIRALFDAGVSVDATWPIDTEREARSVAIGSSALASSITVVCRRRIVGSAASFKEVKKEVEKAVLDSVKLFWKHGYRGADLIVASYGPAVGVFGKYERVERADGTLVEVPELLELAKSAARDAIAGEFRGDNLSTLYYVWANLYGPSEQAWDDARLIVQIGGEASSVMEMARGQGLFVVDGSQCRLALLADRIGRRNLGFDRADGKGVPLIDALHRAMLLWKEEKRRALVAYLAQQDLLEDGPFWKLAQALFEVFPRGNDDWRLISAILSERENLRAEAKRMSPEEMPSIQSELDLDQV